MCVCVCVCACVGVMLCALGVFVFNTNNLSRAWYRQNYNLPHVNSRLIISYVIWKCRNWNRVLMSGRCEVGDDLSDKLGWFLVPESLQI